MKNIFLVRILNYVLSTKHLWMNLTKTALGRGLLKKTTLAC